MKKLMTPLSGQYDPENPADLEAPALRAAFMVAEAFDAHVEALSIVDPPAESIDKWPMWLPGGSVNVVCDMIDAASEARRKHARSQYDEVLAELSSPPPTAEAAAPGYSTRFVERAGAIRDTIAYHGKVSDLLVVASSDMMWLEPFTPIVEACFTQTGRPVLVAPQETPDRIGSRVAIGWDGSAAAARAVASAAPFLEGAERIHVISCEEKKKASPDPESLVELLAWRGLEARPEKIEGPSRSTPEVVFDRALECDCDLMVLGTRVRSRAHRLLFGSVTEYALDEPRLTTFFGP